MCKVFDSIKMMFFLALMERQILGARNEAQSCRDLNGER